MNVNLNALFVNAPGAYTFPASWTEAHDALAMLAAERTRSAARRDEAHTFSQRAERDRAREVLAAARAGALPADLAEPVLDAKADDDRLTVAASIVNLALRFAEDDLAATVVAEADAFILDHLRPALAEVVATVRETVSALAGLDLTDPASLARAPEPARVAYAATLAAADRLRAIRQGQQALGRLRGATPGLDDEIADIERVWPGWNKLRFNGVPARAPWGTDRLAALVWLVTNEAELWIPTTEQAIEARRDRAASPEVRAARRADRRVLVSE